MRAWLEDVLAQARVLHARGLEFLPHDLSDTQKSHDWAMPVMGKPAPGERGIESSRLAFLRAIEQPMRLEEAGRRRYPYTFRSGGAARLAAVFAQARQTQPDAPLVPELQVVLSYMLGQAGSPSTTAGPTGDIVLDVPSAEELEKLIGLALTDHLGRALDRAFPHVRDSATGRTARTRALIALRHLADAEGRRGQGVPEDDLARMIGDGGREVLARLSAADVRLVVVGEDGRVTLSHDRLAEVIVAAVRDEAARGNLLLDQGLLDAQRTIAQKLALFQGDPKDESALTLTHAQEALIRENRDALLVDPHQRAWWGASETYRRRRTAQLARWAAASLVFMLAASFVGYRTYRDFRISSLRAELLQWLSTPEADFARLVSVVADRDFSSGRIELEEEFVRGINPDVFAATPWISPEADPMQVMDVIERTHLLFVPSRPLFGAMSFALEEVSVRSGPGDAGVREQARMLSDAVRSAFIAYHKERTPEFQEPPARAEDDRLNDLVAIPPGEFVMGSEDGPPDERPTHRVLVSAFRMQRHEVTNEEYKRFDPEHPFPSGEERHPVVEVSWHDAAAYAAWLGASLPTEAQWEYAARGTGRSSGREFPWPQGRLDATRAVFGTNRAEPVGSRPAGRTPEGLDDMAGNVWEWCRDWDGPFSSERVSNPVGPIAVANRLRVWRGGSFDLTVDFLRAAYRSWFSPVNRFDGLGFRGVSSRLRP